MQCTTLFVVAMLVASGGCHRGETPVATRDGRATDDPVARTRPADAASPVPEATNLMNATLDWTITRGADSLHVEYALHNGSARTIWVVDEMLVWAQGGLARASKAMIVRNGAAADVASLFRGNLDIPSHDDHPNPSPGMRPVAAGASITGAADIPLPLTAWHPYHPEKMEPLRPGLRRAELEIQVLDSQGTEDRDWEYVTLADGSRVATPYYRVLATRAVVVHGPIEDLP
ncbi:MAG: hypothetical protein KC464_08755 [Myxococcales bacterium]|nr:hypothetical protein [Myxococcales bacterium]